MELEMRPKTIIKLNPMIVFPLIAIMFAQYDLWLRIFLCGLTLIAGFSFVDVYEIEVEEDEMEEE